MNFINKAAAAVSRGEVETIVEFHKKHHNSLNHLELSTERGQNLMKNHKSYGISGQGVNMTSIHGPNIAKSLKDHGRQGFRCCMCCGTGRCVRCSCVIAGKKCSSCIPSRQNLCDNQPSLFTEVIENQNENSIGLTNNNFLDKKMIQAFGATLLKSELGDIEDVWYSRWQRVINLNSRQYDLSGGAVGREFVDLLNMEIKMLNSGLTKSERFITFLVAILQRDSMVKKGTDVRRLLKRRMDAWKDEQFEALIYEVERCANHQRKQSSTEFGDEHIIKIFTRLMLRGQIRAATRWITDRRSGGRGVLDPSSEVESDKTVMDVLREKHPDPVIARERAFLQCGKLPPLIDVDLTGAHIEKVARRIQGSSGPGGTTAFQWQSSSLNMAHIVKD